VVVAHRHLYDARLGLEVGFLVEHKGFGGDSSLESPPYTYLPITDCCIKI
jgi:hypothetical protein